MTTTRIRPSTTRGQDRPTGLLLDIAAGERTTTVRLFGLLDALTARRLRDVARIGSVEDARFVTLDIERVTFVDVAGWRALRGLTADLADQGTTVTQIGGRGRDERLDDLLVRLDRRRCQCPAAPFAPTAA
ncbi:MAG TPA: STAS domain-containing protein [Iamia sp.]|nr:STAS domain-containing protein [Iamia sp.]